MGFLATIGNAIADRLLPVVEEKGKQLLDKAEAEGEKLLARVMDKIAAEFEKRFPALAEALITAVTKAVTQAVGQMAVTGVDKVTDVIPGQLDDQIVDPAVKQGMDVFKDILGRFGF